MVYLHVQGDQKKSYSKVVEIKTRKSFFAGISLLQAYFLMACMTVGN